MPSREAIGQGGNQHRTGMGGHMPAVGHQRHRAIDSAGDDLDQHHAGRKRNHQPHLAFIAQVIVAKKDVFVVGFREFAGGHQRIPWFRWSLSAGCRFISYRPG